MLLKWEKQFSSSEKLFQSHWHLKLLQYCFLNVVSEKPVKETFSTSPPCWVPGCSGVQALLQGNWEYLSPTHFALKTSSPPKKSPLLPPTVLPAAPKSLLQRCRSEPAVLCRRVPRLALCVLKRLVPEYQRAGSAEALAPLAALSTPILFTVPSRCLLPQVKSGLAEQPADTPALLCSYSWNTPLQQLLLQFIFSVEEQETGVFCKQLETSKCGMFRRGRLLHSPPHRRSFRMQHFSSYIHLFYTLLLFFLFNLIKVYIIFSSHQCIRLTAVSRALGQDDI